MKVGQIKSTPTPGDGDRVFYESLYKQSNGESQMALKYMVQYGVFDAEKAAKMAPKMKIDAEKIKVEKATAASKGGAGSSSAPRAKKARIVDETGGDVGAGMAGGAWEGINGQMGM